MAETAPHAPAPRTRTRASRALTLTVATTLALLLGSAPAWAHTELESSTPAADAALPSAPSTVALTFGEDVSPDLATVTVTGPDGTRYENGAPTASGATLNQALRPLGPAGNYRIDYRVVSDDGHPVSGTVPFSLTAPGPGASAAGPAAPPAPPASPETAAGSDAATTPAWPWIVGAVLVVLAGAGLALRRRGA